MLCLTKTGDSNGLKHDPCSLAELFSIQQFQLMFKSQFSDQYLSFLKCFIVIINTGTRRNPYYVEFNRVLCFDIFSVFPYLIFSHLKKGTSHKNIMQEIISRGFYLICPLHTFWGNRNIFRLFLSDIFWSYFLYTDLVTEFLCFLLLICTRQCLFLLNRNIFTEN